MNMKMLCAVVLVTVVHCGLTAARDPITPPKGVPPVLGTAVVTDPGQDGESSEWEISLMIPKLRWTVAGEVIPKKQWPELKAEVEQKTLALRLGGPSQLRESRVVDLKGTELSRDQLLTRLAEVTPVLVSLSGEMPEAYFLQLTHADALIVILGPRDGSPTPDLLPAQKASPATTESSVDQ